MKTNRFVGKVFRFSIVLLLIACSKDYDDGNLWTKVNEIEKRVDDVENTLTRLNTDLKAINVLATSVQNGLSVVDVEQTSTGYVVTYNNGKSFLLPNTKDGHSPYIGSNGNWWIENVDTGVKAKGEDGETVYIRFGTWWVGNTDTGIKAEGTDGLTPFIGVNGHWWIGSKDTGVAAYGNGSGGSDSSDVPILGVDVYTDGRYYWTQTLNGEKTWLLDNNGKMMLVTGNDGQQPIVRINYEGYWVYSFDGGITWLYITDGNGGKVQYSSDGCSCSSYFIFVKVIGKNLVIILIDGTVITIPLDGTDDGGFPDKDDPAPDIPDPDPLPNPLPTVIDSLGNILVRLDMTGIQDTITGEWIKLYGTGDPQQNVWLSLDDEPKGIVVVNNSDESEEAHVRTDIVFTVDNSGSMDDEAEAIARDIISWAQKLSASGLDVRFSCVGYDGRINGGIDFCDAQTLSNFLGRSKGTGRTVGFVGSNASVLESAANGYRTWGECGAMAIRYADATFSFRNLANRIYVNFTDEPNQPDGNTAYSVEFFASQENWPTNKGTVHTVYSSTDVNWTEITLTKEWPWKISDYTGGTKSFTNDSFQGVSLESLRVSGAMMNSYVIYFKIPATMLDGSQHKLTISVLTADGHVHGQRSFWVTFTN